MAMEHNTVESSTWKSVVVRGGRRKSKESGGSD